MNEAIHAHRIPSISESVDSQILKLEEIVKCFTYKLKTFVENNNHDEIQEFNESRNTSTKEKNFRKSISYNKELTKNSNIKDFFKKNNKEYEL